MNQSPFLVKLHELEREDQVLRACLGRCHSMEKDELRRSRQELERQYQEARLHLEDDICDSRSPAVAKLAQAQRTYDLTIQRLMEESLPLDLHSEASTPGEDRTEAMMLYAEYAVDFARQSIRHALLAVLSAMELQQEQGLHPVQCKEEIKP